MIIKKIIVDNYASYKHEEINFDELGNSPYLLCGNNGSGKSTIIEMITTALFNRCRGVDSKGAGMDELIHNNEDSFKIELHFLMNNINYIIVREKTRKSQKLKLYVDGNEKKGKVTEIQQMINDIIKLDYDTFMDTVIIAQGQSASFMNKAPIDRKKVIAQILNLDKYNILESYTKDLRKDLKVKLGVQESQLSQLSSMINNKDYYIASLAEYIQIIDKTNEEISKLEIDIEVITAEKIKYNEMKKQQDQLLSKKNSLESNIKMTKNNIDNSNSMLEKLKDSIKDKTLVITELEELTGQVPELQNIDVSLNGNRIEIKTKNDILQKNINDLKKKAMRLKDYGEAECEFCGQAITEQYKDKHLKEMLKEAKKYKNEIDKNNEILLEVEQKLRDNKQQLKIINSKINELTNKKMTIAQNETRIESLISKISDLQARLIELQEQLSEIPEFDIIVNKTFNDFELKYKLNDLRNKVMNYSNKKSVLENELLKINENESQYIQLKEEYEDNKKLMNNYEELQKAWSKNGIQALIIDNALPQIEDEINKYLSILSNGEINIKFETQKVAKNGNISETLDIIVSDSNGSRPYERYSGGQRTRIDFATHIGLSKFLTKQSGANIEFFVIDEGLGTLDSDGRDSVLETLQSLTGIFKQIFIISHIDEVKEAFTTKILVTNNKEVGSKVQLLK